LAAGDTIGCIGSSETDFLLSQLRGELAVETANLDMYATGEKESLVREARYQVEYAQTQADQQTREVARLRALADKSMAPEADMERAENLLRLYEIQVGINKASLDALLTGSKTEMLDQVRSRIAALQDEIDVLERRMALSTIISPLSGYIVGSVSSDTLAVVCGAGSYAVVLPIRWEDRSLVETNSTVELTVAGLAERPTGRIEYIDRAAVLLNGANVLRAVAVIESGADNLGPGVYARCSIVCQPFKPHEYVLDFLGYRI
jgi:multidrug efflux pump subunit AcrA (membrane-fusion protein)